MGGSILANSVLYEPAAIKVVIVGDPDPAKKIVAKNCGEASPVPKESSSFLVQDFERVSVKLRSTGEIKSFQIWETVGSQDYRMMTASSLKGCAAIIIVCKVGEDYSFKSLGEWNEFIQANATDNPNVSVFANFTNQSNLDPKSPEFRRSEMEAIRKFSIDAVYPIDTDKPQSIRNVFQQLAECL